MVDFLCTHEILAKALNKQVQDPNFHFHPTGGKRHSPSAVVDGTSGGKLQETLKEIFADPDTVYGETFKDAVQLDNMAAFAAQKILKIFDTDRDGLVDQEELSRALKSRGGDCRSSAVVHRRPMLLLVLFPLWSISMFLQPLLLVAGVRAEQSSIFV